MIHVAISGYGNIGKAVHAALLQANDFQLVGIIRQSLPKHTSKNIRGIPLVTHLQDLPKKPDVIILCNPSREVKRVAKKYLSKGICTVDSFDIHTEILPLCKELDILAKQNNTASICAAGWDPGTDSMVRAILELCTPKGITDTNFGPGMSMGHSTAAKAKPGVANALSLTIPKGEGLHRRMVYVTLDGSVAFATVAESIKQDPYFYHDETHVIETEDIDAIKDMGHGVKMVRRGVSGDTHNQWLEFSMRIHNPALTGQILVSSARAVCKQQPGCYTTLEIPLIDFLPGSKDTWIQKLV